MNQLAPSTHQNQVPTTFSSGSFTPQDIQTLKNSYCKDLTDSELKIFLMACSKTRLDPFMKQIYAVKRNTWANGQSTAVMTIQTGIDGYRLIAERTHRYCPGSEPTYEYDNQGKLISATSYIKKQTHDNTWHVVSASAHFDEYCQYYTDKKNNQRRPMGLWGTMPRVMLAKCAESLALRKAFPSELTGIYTDEEMSQSNNSAAQYAGFEECSTDLAKISRFQLDVLNKVLVKVPDYHKFLNRYLLEKMGINTLADIPADHYDVIMREANNCLESKNSKKIQEISDKSNECNEMSEVAQ
jgi:phage recombination protein Bet